MAMVDVDDDSPPSNTIHRMRVRCMDNGKINEFVTEIQNFGVQNGMLCKKHCKANNVDAKCWNKTEPARAHRHMELHNDKTDYQDSEKMSNDKCKGATGVRHTDVTTTLGLNGLAASLDFEENGDCTWNDTDEEFLDDTNEEVKQPREKRARRSNS